MSDPSAAPGPATATPPPRPALQVLAAAAVYVIAATVDLLAGLVLFGLLASVWPPRVGYAPMAWRGVLLVYPPFFIAWLGIALGYLHIMHAVGFPVAPQPELQGLADGGSSTDGFAVRLIVIVVIAPIWEEILFRGYLFAGFAAYLPKVWTHLLTATVFGLVHGLEYAFPVGVLSLLFGYLRARHDALLPAMLAHALHNGITVTVAVLFPETLDWMYPA